jgi:hypothetical protein
VRELHHELHYPGDGNSRTADWREEGDHDHGARIHLQPGDRRHGAEPAEKRSGRRGAEAKLGMTQVVDGDLLKVMSWYDNEWGYSNQLVREAVRISRTMDRQSAAGEP